MASELEAAVVLNMAKLELLVRPELPASKELQKHLTVPLHMRTTDQLVRNADPITKARLDSLLTPHSTAWLVCTPLFRVLAPPETVAGMRWNLGVKLRREPYICHECGCQADAYGLHAVTCLRSGLITKGHTVLRNTVIEVFRRAGVSVECERALPGRDERPADMLIVNWRGKTTAVDFTVVTPNRPSAIQHAHSTNDTLMDEAARAKDRKSAALCNAVGWDFMAFVGDTYGALRSDARALISRLISRHAAKFEPLSETDASRAIWSTVGAAVMSRAAMQLSRLSAIDQPFGMDLDGLSLSNSRMQDTPTTAPLPSPSQLHHPSPTVNMGNEPFIQPSSPQVDGGGIGSEFVGESTAMGATHVSPSAAFAQLPNGVRIPIKSGSSGSELYPYVGPSARLQDLHDLLHSKTGNSSNSYTLSLNGLPVRPGLTLFAQGVASDSVLTHHSLSSAASF